MTKKTNIDTDVLASLIEGADKEMVPFSKTNQAETFDYLPSLIPEVDYVFLGGIPLSGKITGLFGRPEVGKSTLAANLIAIAQKLNITVVYYDVELSTNKTRLEQLGIDTDRIFVKQPGKTRKGAAIPLSIESIMQSMTDIASAVHENNPNSLVLFVWDTVGMTQSELAANSDYYQADMMSQSKALAVGARKLTVNLQKYDASLLALNQARDDPAVANRPPMYKVDKSVGGWGWLHALNLNLEVVKGAKETRTTSDTQPIGHVAKIKFVKSKVGDNSGAVANAKFLQDTGFDIEYNIYSEAQALKWIKLDRTGFATYVNDNGEIIKHRKWDFVNYLKSEEGSEVFQELWSKLVKYYFPECYPALFNLHAIMEEDTFPGVTALREYYMKVQEALPPQQQNPLYKKYVEKYGLPKSVKESIKKAPEPEETKAPKKTKATTSKKK